MEFTDDDSTIRFAARGDAGGGFSGSGVDVGSAARAEDKPIRALLVAGGCCHDYAKQKDILTQGISARRT